MATSGGASKKRAQPIAIRFWAKVVKASEPDGCWIWTAARNTKGYGVVNEIIGNIRFGRAHRLAYVLTHGPIPTGSLVCHRCDVPSCVRPDHLYAGTPKDNSGDMVAKNRQTSGVRNPSAKLSVSQVNAIRALSERGELPMALSSRFDVAVATIRDVLWGRTWRGQDTAAITQN